MTLLIKLLDTALLVCSLVLLVPIGVLLIECLAARLPRHSRYVEEVCGRPRFAVLVPAHNESTGITPTLQAIVPQLTEADRLLVIADNCDDDTAAVARLAGAQVVERHDPHRRGKGYALDFGLQCLASDPPDVVVVIDADCLVEAGALDKLIRLAVNRLRPVQATYLLERPAHPSPKDAVSALAFTVKNLVRPLGLAQLQLPCLLTGTGMAFPWSIIQTVSLASGNIVEDMQLALDLAILGVPTVFCADAHVTGALPQQERAAKSQRTRWEHGHLQTLLTQVPRLMRVAWQQKRLDLLAIALDLSIPPLSLLVMLWTVGTIAAISWQIVAGSVLPTVILVVEGLMILTAILAAWAKFGRSELPLVALLSVPFYILWKIPLYFSFLVKRQTKWVRTERDAAESPEI